MRKYKAHTGKNCLQACVAGLMDLPLDSVIDIGDCGVNWYDIFYMFCKDELGYIPVVVTDYNLEHLWNIEVVEIPGGLGHARICYGNKVIWDPYSKDYKVFCNAYNIIFINIKDNIDKTQMHSINMEF